MKMPVLPEVVGDVSAPSLAEEFLRAADDFAAMQQKHRAALLAGNATELFLWRQGREQAFRGLARILDKVVACGEEERGCLARVREVMGKLLAEEEVLQEFIQAHQLKIQEQLQAMRKGKEALHGYNINKGQVPRPRYLSSRM